MEFIENHFYKLTKELPKKQLIAMPSGFTNANTDICGNSNMCGSYSISTFGSNCNMIASYVYTYESSAMFTIGRIYQASSSIALYDDTGNRYYLKENEIECFEEIEVGLNDVSKKFMEKHINSRKMEFKFNFLNDNSMVTLKLSLNGKHATWVCLIGIPDEINEMIHNAYKELRKAYIKRFKGELQGQKLWQLYPINGNGYVCDIETAGRDGYFVGPV